MVGGKLSESLFEEVDAELDVEVLFLEIIDVLSPLLCECRELRNWEDAPFLGRAV